MNIVKIIGMVQAFQLDILLEKVVVGYLNSMSANNVGFHPSSIMTLDLSRWPDGTIELCIHLKNGRAFTVTFNA